MLHPQQVGITDPVLQLRMGGEPKKTQPSREKHKTRQGEGGFPAVLRKDACGCAHSIEIHPAELVWSASSFGLEPRKMLLVQKNDGKPSLFHPSVTLLVGELLRVAPLGGRGHAGSTPVGAGISAPGGRGPQALTSCLLSPRSCWPLPTGPCWPRLSRWLRSPAPLGLLPSSPWPWALFWEQLLCTGPTCSSRCW